MKITGCLFTLVVALGCYHVHAGSVGVNLGFGRSSQPYGEALQHLKDRGVRFIKTFSINPDWLNEVESVYAGVDVHVTVAIPNGDLSGAAYDQGYLYYILGIFQQHRRIIKLVAIGNEPFHEGNRPIAMPYLETAYNNVVKMLADNGLQNDIKVTIPFSAVALVNTYPVESSEFHPDIIGVIRNIAPTMMNTGSVFSINLYPFFAYIYSSDIPLDFALGRQGSLFEAMLRGCRVALDKIGANYLPIIVGESGWPSDGGPRDTNIENEKAFVEHIVNFARTNSLAQIIYIFEAFDESEKPGAESEKHFGIEYENRQPKFDIDISSYQTCTKGWQLHDFETIVNANLGNPVPANKSKDCQEFCRRTPGCGGYSWASNVCYLKRKGEFSFKPASGVFSAVIC